MLIVLIGYNINHFFMPGIQEIEFEHRTSLVFKVCKNCVVTLNIRLFQYETFWKTSVRYSDTTLWIHPLDCLTIKSKAISTWYLEGI